MEKKKNKKIKLTALAIILGIANFAKASFDAGSLNKQLEQRQNHPIASPSGELFQASPLNVQHNSRNNNTKLILNQIQLVGIDDEVLSDDLSFLMAPYINRPITLNQLNELVQAITRYYRQNNYFVARAFLPPQEIIEGRIQIKVMKGELGNIYIKNDSRFREFLIKRMANTTVKDELFLKKEELDTFALLLNDIPGISPQLTLKAGRKTGQTDLFIQLNTQRNMSSYIMMDNQGNNQTGKYRFTVGGKAYNLLGVGDELQLDVLSSHRAKLSNFRLDYSGIIDGYGTRLGITASYLKYKLGGNFKDLNSSGHANNVSLYILHPTIRSPYFRLNTRVAFTHQKLTDKQSAVKIRQDRRINTINLGVSGSWNSVKNGVSYFSASATFGHENNVTNEKAHYLADNYQPKRSFSLINYSLSHEQYLPASFALNLSISGQFTDKNLDSSQKMLLGGTWGARGYQAGDASVDEGHVAQVELKHYAPFFKQNLLISSVFYDYGIGKQYKNARNLNQEVKNTVRLQSIGMAYTFSAPNNYSLSMSYAKPVGKKDVKTDNHQIWLSAVKTF
ncbi:MAG: ShlB/FhaC/HecB family hemolysin secretion/activation protein [[Pasteurella] mairii]|uniref:Hemolysin activation/secretion protein-2 n=1 Tax=[Pasteurella] mairii TaxID=757 RepID=A0A379B1R3_9PAST|nr:ShlB/FhaC/HecB family hemolysin secretion/activation protein [[Pasteurella] mairii]SUB32564.1 hemolysin activation/secretion protein-2 [[Pasteurella] mairii]